MGFSPFPLHLGDRFLITSAFPWFVEPSIDLGDFRHPSPAFEMIEPDNLLMRPVKMIRNIRYLLVQPR
jgi:hypothetical protein